MVVDSRAAGKRRPPSDEARQKRSDGSPESDRPQGRDTVRQPTMPEHLDTSLDAAKRNPGAGVEFVMRRWCTAPGFSDTRQRYAASCVAMVAAIQFRRVSAGLR